LIGEEGKDGGDEEGESEEDCDVMF